MTRHANMRTTTLFASLVTLLMAGCDNAPVAHPLPEVNDANCQIERIKKIEHQATREAFASLCSRRVPAGGGIAPTEAPLNWLELADPKHQKGTQP